MSLLCGFAVLLADQWTKSAVLAHGLPFVRHRSRAYERPIALTLVWMFALICAIFEYRCSTHFHSPAALTGLGLAFGGAAGNLIDILRRRYVIDFIDLGWWPVFNLADAAIVAGFAAAFLG